MLDNTLQRLSIALFLASLVLPAVHFSNDDPVFGYKLLLLGWLGLFEMHFPWLANVLYLSSLENIRAHNFRRALWLSVLCIPIGLLSLRFEKWYLFDTWGAPTTGLGVAFYLWVSSFIVLSIELWGRQSREKKLLGTNTIQKAQEPSKEYFEKGVAPLQEIRNRKN